MLCANPSIEEGKHLIPLLDIGAVVLELKDGLAKVITFIDDEKLFSN